jgi:hypothetical protein
VSFTLTADALATGEFQYARCALVFLLPSFVSGALMATALVTVPMAVAAVDANPSAVDSTAPSLTIQPVEFRLGESIDAAAPEGECDEKANSGVPMRVRWECH